MSINSKSCRSDAVVRSGIAARLAEIKARADEDAEFCSTARTDVPALVNAVDDVIDYVDRCEESGITMQPGDIRRLIAAALGSAS